MPTSRARSALSGALITATSLWGGLFLGLVAGNLVSAGLPGHMVFRVSLGLLLMLLGLVVGGAGWGSRMGRLAQSPERGRMRWAGVFGFVPVTLALGAGLLPLESVAVEAWSGRLPVHRVFMLLFVPTAFLIPAAAAFGLGIGLRSSDQGFSLAWRAGLAAAGVFLVVNLLMEALGWQVGGPGAAERYTMLTVTFAGALGSALAAGAVIGYRLGPSGKQPVDP